MISLDVKAASPASSPLLGSDLIQDVPSLSFSDLLKGVSLKKDDKIIQNGSLVLSLQNEIKETKTDVKLTKNDNLLSLLQLDIREKKDSQEPLALNPNITNALNVSDVKVLMQEAKEYLKSKILASEDFKKFELKNLPKTLKGLTQVAKKFGIDISKITLEDVKPHVKLETKEVKSNFDIKLKVQSADTEISQESSNIKKVLPKDKLQTEKVDITQNLNQKEEVQIVREVKSTPLFKAQVHTEHTTEQIVQTKLASIEPKLPKKKADETLKVLLSGDKVQKNNTILTADFSVATAKVIAPEATHKVSKTLESLLKDTSSDSSEISKLDGLNVHKADSFEVKLNEAKQMTKYLSQDVKTAIEDYKSPFTRIKVQLNPQRLGEVDLTIVQRGKNLHINLSSNNVAINTLAMNASDLKVQLQNSGINNASLNFNNNAQSDNSAANQQQQQRQNEQEAQDEYDYFESKEKHEEILSSLEIVVPHYA